MGNGNGTNGTLASNREAMDRFIEKLRNSGNVRLACRAADVPRSTAYRWRDKWTTFADEWAEALEDACDILEGEAWKRAVEDKSDRLLMFLLKAHRPDKFKERTQTEVSGPEGGPVIVEHELDADTIAEALRILGGPDGCSCG